MNQRITTTRADMYTEIPIDMEKYLETVIVSCAESLRDEKVPEVVFDIRYLSGKQISIIRDIMKKYDSIEETSSMLKLERKK